MIRLAVAATVSALLLAGCGSPADQTAAGNAAAPAVESKAAPAPGPAEPAALARPQLALDGEGLRLASGASATPIPFGTARDAVVEAVGKSLGAPPSEQGRNEECGSGAQDYVGWKDGITLWFQDGGFVGWDSKGKLASADGVGLGTQRDRITARELEVSETSLGEEFSSGGISGLFASGAPDAKVTALWAGATCLFR